MRWLRELFDAMIETSLYNEKSIHKNNQEDSTCENIYLEKDTS